MSSPTYKEIVDYWAGAEEESGLAVDWIEAHERCWRCGYKTKLEKCHIVPSSLGGSAARGNLVLLCGRCHREAPNHQNSQYMWIWLRATCVPFYDSYWTIRGLAEFEQMFGRKILAWATGSEIDPDRLLQEFNVLLKKQFDKVIVHFGEGRLNPSTIACMMAEVEKELGNRYGKDF